MVSAATVQLCHSRVAIFLYLNEWMWLCSNKTLFTESGGACSSLLTHGLEAQVLALASSLTHSDLLRHSFTLTRPLYHLQDRDSTVDSYFRVYEMVK